MRKIIFSALGLLGVLVVSIVALPFVLPLESFKDDISLAVEGATGRTFSVGGKLSLAVFPDIAFEMNGVSVGNAEGYSSDSMAQLSSLKVKVSTLALLSGKVQVKELVLDKPTFNLEVNKDGKGNWVLEQQSSGAITAKGNAIQENKTEDAPAIKGNASGSAAPTLPDINLGNVKIIDATIKFSDFGASTQQSVENLNASFKLESFASPFTVKSDFVWNGQKFATSISVNSPQSLLDGSKTALNFDVSSNSIKTNGGGDFTLTLGEVTSVAANLNIKEISIHSDRIPSAKKIDTPVGQQMALATTSPAKPKNDKGEKKGKLFELSKDPLDLSGLKSVNADVGLSIGSVKINDVKAGPIALAAKLNNGKLDFNLKEMALYGGNISSTLALDGSSKKAKIKPSLTVSNLKYHELLEDLGILVQVGAELSTNINLSTSGGSVHEIVSKLTGKGDIDVNRAGIIRVDPKTYLMELAGDWGGKIGEFISDKSFEALKGRDARLQIPLVFSNGNISVAGLDLKGPVVNAEGKGSLSLISQSLNLRMVPMLVASVDGAATATNVRGVRVPFFVKGSFAEPVIKIDEEALAREMAKQGVKAGIHMAIQNELKNSFGAGVETNEFTNNLIDGIADVVSGGGGKKEGSGDSTISNAVDDVGKTIGDIGSKIGGFFSNNKK